MLIKPPDKRVGCPWNYFNYYVYTVFRHAILYSVTNRWPILTRCRVGNPTSQLEPKRRQGIDVPAGHAASRAKPINPGSFIPSYSHLERHDYRSLRPKFTVPETDNSLRTRLKYRVTIIISSKPWTAVHETRKQRFNKKKIRDELIALHDNRMLGKRQLHKINFRMKCYGLPGDCGSVK